MEVTRLFNFWFCFRFMVFCIGISAVNGVSFNLVLSPSLVKLSSEIIAALSFGCQKSQLKGRQKGKMQFKIRFFLDKNLSILTHRDYVTRCFSGWRNLNGTSPIRKLGSFSLALHHSLYDKLLCNLSGFETNMDLMTFFSVNLIIRQPVWFLFTL